MLRGMRQLWEHQRQQQQQQQQRQQQQPPQQPQQPLAARQEQVPPQAATPVAQKQQPGGQQRHSAVADQAIGRSHAPGGEQQQQQQSVRLQQRRQEPGQQGDQSQQPIEPTQRQQQQQEEEDEEGQEEEGGEQEEEGESDQEEQEDDEEEAAGAEGRGGDADTRSGERSPAVDGSLESAYGEEEEEEEGGEEESMEEEEEEEEGEDEEEGADEEWSVPETFLPLPAAFKGRQSALLDLRRLPQDKLAAAAARHNERHLPAGARDPGAAALEGIAERAALRPGLAPAATFTIGGVPPGTTYARAWSSIGGGMRLRAAPTKQAPSSSKPAVDLNPTSSGGASAGAAPAGSSQAAPAAPPGPPAAPPLSKEEAAWRARLASFLGYKLRVPRLSPGAPNLELKQLWQEVMARGGQATVTLDGGWRDLAADLVRDEALADLVAAAYDCFLEPLERVLPWQSRVARALDAADSHAARRAEMGCRLPTYGAAAHAAARAEGALLALERPGVVAAAVTAGGAVAGGAPPAASPETQEKQQQEQQQQQQQQQQQEQQQERDKGKKASPKPTAEPTDPRRAAAEALALLRLAGQKPGSVVRLFRRGSRQLLALAPLVNGSRAAARAATAAEAAAAGPASTWFSGGEGRRGGSSRKHAKAAPLQPDGKGQPAPSKVEQVQGPRLSRAPSPAATPAAPAALPAVADPAARPTTAAAAAAADPAAAVAAAAPSDAATAAPWPEDAVSRGLQEPRATRAAVLLARAAAADPLAAAALLLRAGTAPEMHAPQQKMCRRDAQRARRARRAARKGVPAGSSSSEMDAGFETEEQEDGAQTDAAAAGTGVRPRLPLLAPAPLPQAEAPAPRAAHLVASAFTAGQKKRAAEAERPSAEAGSVSKRMKVRGGGAAKAPSRTDSPQRAPTPQSTPQRAPQKPSPPPRLPPLQLPARPPLPASSSSPLPGALLTRLSAARWLLLSLRQLRGAPPGARKLPRLRILCSCCVPLEPLLPPPPPLPPRTAGGSQAGAGGAAEKAPAPRARPSGGRAEREQRAPPAPRGNKPPEVEALWRERPKGGVRRMWGGGPTPKCGDCKPCLNPQMKQACVVNRRRIAQGLPPILPK